MKTKITSVRKIYILLAVVVALFATILLASCSGEKTIVGCEILNVPQAINVGEFDSEMNNIKEAVDASDMKIRVKYDDETTEDISLTFDMLDDAFQQQLNSEGRHYISYTYKGNKVSFELLVKGEKTYTVRFYGKDDKLISEQKVKAGATAVEPTEAEREAEGYAFTGWDKSFDNVTADLEIRGKYEKAFTVTFYNGKNQLIDTQYVKNGGDAQSPSEEAKYLPGYIFSKWDTELTNIQEDTVIYGIYINDNVTDTDGDGIIDYIEIEILNLDYTKVDTDGNGITDDKEDFDNDGLNNITEIKSFLKPNDPDTDGDGLTDGDEVNIYWTLPADPDTDGDGADDAWEINNNFDPVIYNESFSVELSVPLEDGSSLAVDIPELPGEYVDKVIVELSKDESIKDVHGAIGEAIQYNVSASANITFSSEEIADAEDPVLMYFNTETNEVETIAITVSGNEATANITTYGSYVLVDRKVFEEKGQWRDVFNSGSFTSIEIVFVIDDSGSMGPVGVNNDPSNKRLSVTQSLIDALPSSAKIGIVRFDDYATALTTTLTGSKDEAKAFLTTQYFDSRGSTLLYSGAMTALNLYSATEENDGVMRVMVLLSDGSPSSDSKTAQNVLNGANAQGVKIYTVGLGNSTSDFDKVLKPLSEQTGAEYMHSSNASALQNIYDAIGEKIDMEIDTDGDGIADFFESGVDKNGVPTLPTINGMDFTGLDKENPDTDQDGYMDGEEIEIYKYYSDTNPNQVMVWGIVNSNPLDPESVPKEK